jgi:adenosylcobinamide-GDP ribazoletransferase
MSNVKTIKTFRDLLSFLTIIPVCEDSNYIFNTADHMYLFTLIGAFIGVLAGGYYLAANYIVNFMLNEINNFVALPTVLIARLVVAAMTVAFLMVITGLQHFDGIIDLGNTFGLRNIQDRKDVAHAWTVTYWGALLAFIVEAGAFVGLFLINPVFAFGAILASEASAKLAMVTIAWVGKPAHKGLGSIFLAKAKKKLNIAAYVIALAVSFPIFAWQLGLAKGLVCMAIVLVSVPVAFLMRAISNRVFGGVSGDTIGATNEVARTITLVLLAVALWALAL